MPTVKVLHDAVGAYNAGDIVPDAPAGLIEIAEKGTLNAATGLPLAEIVDDVTDEFEEMKAKAKELKIRGFANMKYETLVAAVQAAEEAQKQQQTDDPANQGQEEEQTTPPAGVVTTDGTNPDQ